MLLLYLVSILYSFKVSIFYMKINLTTAIHCCVSFHGGILPHWGSSFLFLPWDIVSFILTSHNFTFHCFWPVFFFMARLTIVREPYDFALSVRPSVHPSMGSTFFCLKTRFYGVFEKVWGVFDVFGFCPCVRACVTLYVLSFVDWTCPRVLVRSTWNLFRSTIYELKLCTSYFWSMSIRPSVRQNGRNIAPHRVTNDFFFNLVDWTCPMVLVQSTWNLFRSTVYELKLCTSYFWSTSIRPSVRRDVRNIAPDSISVIYMIFVNVLSWTYLRLLVGSLWNLHICNIYGLQLCPTSWGRHRTVRFSVRGVGT